VEDRRSRAGRVRGRGRGALLVGAVSATAIAFGVLVSRKPVLAAAVAGLVAVWSVRDLRHRVVGSASTGVTWIPTAWLILFFVSDWKLTFRSPLAAVSGSLTFENKVEIAAYLLVAALTFFYLYPMRGVRERIPVFPLIAWPLFAVLSTAWSLIPLFSLIRSLQLFVPIALCILMVRSWQQDPQAGAILFRRTLRLIIQLITVLVIFGFISHHRWPQARFTWPGAPHPIVASGIAGLGLVFLVAGGRAATGFSLLSFLGRISLFSAALVFGQTRSALLAVALAILTTLWLVGRSKPGSRYFTISFFLGALFFIATSTGVVGYLERGQYGGLSTLNGRLPLWTIALGDVARSGRWLVGAGYGSTRVILFPQISYAGEAHNSWVQFLIELGLIGVALAVIWVAFLGFRLFRSRPSFSTTDRWVAAAFVYLLVLSGADDYLSAPSFAFTTIVLFYALALTQDRPPRLRDVRLGAASKTVPPKAPGLAPARDAGQTSA
jgi:hypothetical protein